MHPDENNDARYAHDGDEDCNCPCHDKRVTDWDCPDSCSCDCHDDDDESPKEDDTTPLARANAFDIGRNIEPEPHHHVVLYGVIFALIVMAIGIAPHVKQRLESLRMKQAVTTSDDEHRHDTTPNDTLTTTWCTPDQAAASVDVCKTEKIAPTVGVSIDKKSHKVVLTMSTGDANFVSYQKGFTPVPIEAHQGDTLTIDLTEAR